MRFHDLFPLPCFKIERVDVDDQTIQCLISTTSVSAICPECEAPSTSVHSYYWRKPADLPITDKHLHLKLRVRRFRCRNEECLKSTFAERLAPFLPVHARRTRRLTDTIYHAGQELGGQAASRLLERIRIVCSRDTILRILRTESQERNQPELSVIGMDDWALCKRMKYGLIIVDLLRKCIVDLLPDRSAETVKKWLLRHPHVGIIARDRSLELRQGISEGAPDAVQVADRFHLLQNLTDTLFKIVTSRYDRIKQILKTREEDVRKPRKVSPEHDTPETPASTPTAAELCRRNLIETARNLHRRGLTVKAIAAKLDRNPKTISRYLRMTGEAWRHRRRKRGTLLDPYKSYLIDRWSEGCRVGSLLFDEIEARGYQGKITRLRDFLRRLKQGEINVPGVDFHPEDRSPRPTPRKLAFLMGRPEEALPPGMDELIRRLRTEDEQLDETVGLAREFTDLINLRKSNDLVGWINKAKSARALPLRRFAISLDGDLEAVRAALDYEWSNGPTEGHINRLKMVKRQMYGRANLDLLTIRVAGARPP